MHVGLLKIFDFIFFVAHSPYFFVKLEKKLNIFFKFIEPPKCLGLHCFQDQLLFIFRNVLSTAIMKDIFNFTLDLKPKKYHTQYTLFTQPHIDFLQVFRLVLMLGVIFWHCSLMNYLQFEILCTNLCIKLLIRLVSMELLIAPNRSLC